MIPTGMEYNMEYNMEYTYVTHTFGNDTGILYVYFCIHNTGAYMLILNERLAME